MPSLTRLVEVWAAGADGRGASGSGWVVGTSGVLTARHVVEPYLAAGPDAGRTLQVRRAGAVAASEWVDCTVVWHAEECDLVLLRVALADRWEPATDPAPRIARLSDRPAGCTASGFPDAERRPDEVRGTEQATGRLLPGGALRESAGLMPFDVDTSVPDEAKLWGGFSGAAVHDEHGRLVGVVAKVDPKRQQRRLLVYPVAEAIAGDDSFAAAAATVGVDSAVEDFDAPMWRSCVEPRALTVEGAPALVRDVADLAVFGVHPRTASPSDRDDLGYVARDKDREIDAALAAATTGSRRFVLVSGDSAAGKSRSTAEAARRHTTLGGWRLVVPLADGGVRRLADSGLDLSRTVLWLDDVDKYLGAGLDVGTLRRVLAEHPTAACVATIRTSQLAARQSGLVDPAWIFLTDDTVVARVRLGAELSDRERAGVAARTSDEVLLAELERGVGLGEWLIAGPQLIEKLANGQQPSRAFADTVVAWYRTGLDEPLAEADAQRLWVEAMPEAIRHRFAGLAPEQRDARFREAVDWATASVVGRDLYEQALVSRRDGGFVAHDYVVDRVAREPHRRSVPDAIWRDALDTARRDTDSRSRAARIWQIGSAADQENAFEPALAAWRTIAAEGNPVASFNVGATLGQMARHGEALAAYDDLVGRFADATEPALREMFARALLNRSVTLDRLDRPEDALTAYQDLIGRFADATEPALREALANALYNQGVTLGKLDRPEEELAAYQDLIGRFADATEPALREALACALYNQGVTLGELDRSLEELAAYQDLIGRFADDPEPALREMVARALLNRGVTLSRLDRPEDALTAYQDLIGRFADAPEPALRAQVAKALLNRGVALGRLDRPEDALTAYQDLTGRFADAPEPALRAQVAKALFGQGVALRQLDRSEEALVVLTEVETRFADDTEPVVRDVVERGRALKTLIESIRSSEG